MLVFKLIDGEFARSGGYVDILMDDMAYPSYSSAKIKSNNMTFNEGMLVGLESLDRLLTSVQLAIQ